MTGWIFVALLASLTLLCARTLMVLGTAAPWTSAGWLATIGYDCTATFEIVAHRHLPMHVPYAFLAALTLAFIVAGIRDEPQGEPWWWPARLGATRAQRGRSDTA